MKRAESAVVAVGAPSTSVCQYSMSDSSAGTACRRGVIATVAVRVGGSVVGYSGGDVAVSSNGDGVPPSVGAVSAIVPVPIDASDAFDDVVGWLTQNVPRSTFVVAS